MIDFNAAENIVTRIGGFEKDVLAAGAVVSYGIAAFAIVVGTGFVVLYRIK